MSILSGYDAVKLHKVDDNGDYKRVSPWVSADTVELPENEPLTNYVNRGAYIDDWDEEVDPVKDVVINDNRTATDEVWSSKKTSDTINAVTNTTYTLDDTTDDIIVLTDSNGNEQTKIVNHVASAAVADEALALQLVGTTGDEYTPTYFNGGLPTECRFKVVHGVLAANSAYSFFCKRGTVSVARATTSSTATYAILDQWGGIVYVSTNTDMALRLEDYDGNGNGATYSIVNNTEANVNYVITMGL